MTFTHEQRHDLLGVAETAIRHRLVDGTRWEPDGVEHDAALAEPGASFVTLLDERAQLLGCIGALEPRRPLVVDVAEHAVAAAFHDPRLPPLSRREFEVMTIEISVLSPLELLPVAEHAELAERLRAGTDGLVVEAGSTRATFLPAVWAKMTSADEFLDHLWHKAGMTPGRWPRGTRVWRYTTESFHAPGPRSLAAD